MKKKSFDVFTIRQMQVYVAVCLWKYCSESKIRHEYIDELFHHLLSLSSAENLPDWERKGTLISLCGRGDPLPEAIILLIPDEQLQDFSRLVEDTIEVGIADMYGAITTYPREYLNECVTILKKNKMDIPNPELVLDYSQGINVSKLPRSENDAWGECFEENALENILKAFGVDWKLN